MPLRPHECTLYITKLECLHSSTESKRDDVYIKIYPNGDESMETVYFHGSPIKMNEFGTNDCVRYVDIELDVTYLDSVRVCLWDKDISGNPDDLLGEITITRDDEIEGYKTAVQTTGDAVAQYDVHWRVIDKPIPSMRILGIKCQKSSAGCNAEVIHEVADAASACASGASQIFGMSRNPRGELLSLGFDAAATIIQGIASFAEWIANVGEGADDVYLQHVDLNDPNGGRGAFCPPSESGARCIKMNDGDSVSFLDRYGRYFRFPLDRGDVTIHIREGDPGSDGISLGSLTIRQEDYESLLEGGATTALATAHILDGSGGQGSVYHLCYSVALENWAHTDIPDYVPSGDRWTAWTPLPIGDPVTSSPAVLTDANGDVTCFARGPAGQLVSRRLVAGQWSDWDDLGGSIIDEPAITRSDEQCVHVVVRGTNDTLWQRVLRAGHWEEWYGIGGGAVSSSPTLACVRPGTLDCFARGPDGALLHRSYASPEVSDGSGWTDWTNLGGNIVGAPAAAAVPVGVGVATQDLVVVAQGDDGQLWERRRSGTEWNDWRCLGGGALGSAPSLTTRGRERVDCFAQTIYGTVIHRIYDCGEWSGWFELDVREPVLGTPGAAASLGTRVDLLVCDSAGRLRHSIGAISSPEPGATARFSMVAWAEDEVECFTIGPDGHLLGRLLGDSGSETWQDWGQVTEPGLTYAPAMSGDLPGASARVESLIVKGGWDHWHRARLDRDDPWTEWITVEGHHGIGGSPVLASLAPHLLFAFFPGSSGDLVHMRCENGRWRSPTVISNADIQGEPAVARSGRERIDVVYCGASDGVLYHRWIDGGHWSESWVALDGEPTASSPTMCSRGEGLLDCFAKSANGTLLRRVHEDGAWGEWTEVPDTEGMRSAPTVVATSGKSMRVVAEAMDGSLWTRTIRVPDGPDWAEQPQAPLEPEGPDMALQLSSAPALISRTPDTLECFARGPDHTLLRAVRTGGVWGPWLDVGGDVTFELAPSAIVLGDTGEVEVFVDTPRPEPDKSYHKPQRSRHTACAWTPWAVVDDLTVYSGLALVSPGPGLLAVFYKHIYGNYKVVFSALYDASSGTSVLDHPLHGEPQGRPAAASWAPGRTDVVFRGNDDQLYHRYCLGNVCDDAYWSADWENLGGAAIASSPALCSRAPGYLDCFAQGADGTLLRRTYQQGAWGEWSALSDGVRISTAPSAVALDERTIEVAALDEDGRLWCTTLHESAPEPWEPAPDTEWTPWLDLPERDLPFSPAVVSWGPDRIECVAVTSSELKGVTRRDGHWGNWVGFDFHIQGVRGDYMGAPAISAWSAGTERLDLVVPYISDYGATQGQTVLRYAFREEGEWSNWAPVANDVIGEGGALVSWERGLLAYFEIGADGQMRVQRYEDWRWSERQIIGGSSISVVGVPTAIFMGSGVVEVYARSTDDELVTLSGDGDTWGTWERCGGGALTSSPSACRRSASRRDVFARGHDGALMRRICEGGTWGDWEETDAKKILRGRPSVCASGEQRVDVVALIEGTQSASQTSRVE